MRCGVFLAACLAVLSACGVETAGGGEPTTGGSSKGDSSTAGSSTGGGVVIDCTPGETFCKGETVWRCTYTGRDAALLMPCDAPAVGMRCVTDAVACDNAGVPGNKACCR